MSGWPSWSTSKTPAASNSLRPLIVCCFHFGSSARIVPAAIAAIDQTARMDREPVMAHLPIVLGRSNARQRPGLAIVLGQVLIGLGVVGDPFGDRIPLERFTGPERDVAEVADGRQAVAVAEVARAPGARLDGVEPLAVMSHRPGQAPGRFVDLAPLRGDD